MDTPTTDERMDPALLARTAARCSERPEFLGHELQREREDQGWTEEQQAAAQGCEVETLHRLALCFLPRSEEGCQRIGARFGMPPEGLSRYLR